MQPETEHTEIKRLLQQNHDLLEENNRLLRKLHRGAAWAFWFRLSTYLILIGVPVILYYLVIEPYLGMVGSDYQSIMETINQLGGLDSLNRLLEPPR